MHDLMKQNTVGIRHFVVACFLLALGACGGDDNGGAGEGTPPPAPPPQTGIGAAGGTVTGPDGAKVVIPAGALTTNIDIKVELSSAGAPALPAGFTAVGQMFAFTPHGTTFATPVTMTLPFDPASVPAGRAPQFYKTNAQNQWEQVANATFDATSVSAPVTSFSDATVVIPPLTQAQLVRVWSFREFRGDALEEVEVSSGEAPGDENLEEFFEYGPASFDLELQLLGGGSIPPDGIAVGSVYSTLDGVSYEVSAEAPIGNAQLPNDPIGSKARLVQFQTFTKNAADATYRFTLTSVLLEGIDGNQMLGRACPAGLDLLGVACDLIKAEVYLDVKAFTSEPGTVQTVFFRTAGGASVNGSGGHWLTSAWNESFSRIPLWTTENFDFTEEDFGGPDGQLLMEFSRPRTYTVDLSSVPVGGSFTVAVDAFASTYNRAAIVVSNVGSESESGANAYLRDPLKIGGSTTVVTTGLTPIATALPLVHPVEVPVSPAPCVTDPGQAGVLQFSAPSFSVGETNTTPVIVVTRTGGSAGAVTATFTTSDGTALAGADYNAVNATVFFADGDTTSRAVAVPIVQDLLDESDKTVNLTLSQPGGCATLGAQTSAVLTIHDNEVTPPFEPAGVLDASFGAAGKATLTAFGGDRSAMALQPDGKIVIVGGTFTDFILARFNADGSLDTSFDADGKVTTDMVSNEQEEALGVATQPDGKIVVVGYTGAPGPGGPSSFALARYNTDGSLDTSFGSSGKVVSGVLGNAYAIAIQSDGKIVVAGDVPISSGADFADFVLARYNINGTLDAGFGSGGQVTTDIGGGTNTARNIVLQPNGAIVVSGEPFGTFTGSDHTDVVRYQSNGNPDATFGAGGKLMLNGARVGEGLALQGDGKFVLVGNVDVSVPPALPGSVTEFAVRRLNADGGTDNSFGGAGAASTTISGQRDSAQAVALQSDGKIVVAGRSSNTNVNFAVARFNSDGTLDTDFADDGKLTIDFFGFTDIAENVTVQPDGKIVLGGLARDDVDGYGLARVNP
jgi:uncharacterized delta-60 repeat protein